MKVLGDGFKVIEKDDKVIPDCLYAMNENLVLLHDMIVQMQGVEPVYHGKAPYCGDPDCGASLDERWRRCKTCGTYIDW